MNDEGAKPIHVRVFAPAEWRLYRELRLAALEDAPDAFGSTHGEALARPEQAWRARLADPQPRWDAPLLAEFEDRPAGLAWATIEPASVELAHLFQMWVAPTCRGHGIGQALVERAIEWARNQGARRMLLTVACGNDPARRLYQRAGFVAIGDPEPMRRSAGLLEQPMALPL